MASWYLINTVTVLSHVMYAGTLLDDTVDDVTSVQNAGGRILPSATSGLAAASAEAQNAVLRGQAESAESIMEAAVNKSQDQSIAGQNTVDPTTAVNNTATAVNNTATAAVTNAVATTRKLMCFAPTSLPAAGVTVHATDAGGGALNLVAGFTNPLPRRTLKIARSNAGPGSVTYHCTGNLPDGSSIAVDLAVAINANATTTVAAEWTAITTSVDPVSTSTITTGTGFNVGDIMSLAPVLSVDGVVQAAASVDQASGTVVPTTAPDGAKAFAVEVYATHTHTATDGGHTHTQVAHTHTQVAHTHTLS